MQSTTRTQELILHGIAASPGVAQGDAFVFLQKELEVPLYRVDAYKSGDEITRFERALMDTRKEVSQLRSEVSLKLGEAEARIFDAHMLVLEDRALIEETISEHRKSLINIEYCFHTVAQRYIEAFAHINDEYIKERVMDIRDVTRRLLNRLMGKRRTGIGPIEGERVIISEYLSPSDTASLDKSKVLAFITDGGSRTSHTVIMARSLKVPAVVGLHNVTQLVQNGDSILVDGYEGVVIINPSEQTLFRYNHYQLQQEKAQTVFLKAIPLPSKTADAYPFRLYSNIESDKEVPLVVNSNSEGVGLFRTEGLFLASHKIPNEEQQYSVYYNTVRELHPKMVTIRTLDLGGDKRLSGTLFSEENEENPFMGFRAIRFCLENRDIFKTQLRAILRASSLGNVQMMYPMISGLTELRLANQVLNEAKRELVKEGLPFNEKMRVGMMIEVPSAAMMADVLARECDFFSIGTNDLIQYLLAVDRVNDKIAHLYQPNHPSVLRLIAMVIEVAKKHRMDISVCGEMAGELLYAPLLLGMGITDFSMSPATIPEIKYLLTKVRIKDCKKLANRVMTLTNPQESFEVLRAFYDEHMKDVVG